MNESEYYVYILECEDGSLYTGISTDPNRRFEEHKSGKLGAKYTKAHKPIKIIYTEHCKNRSEASKREYEIKQMTKAQKIELVQSYKKSASKT